MKFKNALAMTMIASALQVPVNAKTVANSIFPKLQVKEERSLWDNMMGFLKGNISSANRISVAKVGFGYNSDEDSFKHPCMEIKDNQINSNEFSEEEMRNGVGAGGSLQLGTGVIGRAEGRVKVEIETGQSSIANTMGIDGSGRIDLASVKGSGALNILKLSHSDEKTLTFVLTGDFVSGNKILPSNATFIPRTYMQMQGDAKKFMEQCGDEVVKEIQLGGKLVIALKMQFSSSKIKDDFQAKLKAEINASGVEVELNGAFKELSNTYREHTKMTITAHQIGGYPHKLFEILKGEDSVDNKMLHAKSDEDKPSASSALIKCSAGDFSSCYRSMGRFMHYAGSSFVEQISKNPAILNYVTESSFSDKFFVGENPFNETPNNIALKNFFATSLKKTKKIVGKLAQIDALIDPPRGLRVTNDQKKNYQKIEKYLTGQLLYLADQSKSCMMDPAGCRSNMANVNDNISMIVNSEIFALNPVSFAQYCDMAGKDFSIFEVDSSTKNAINDSFEFMDRWIQYHASNDRRNSDGDSISPSTEYKELLDRIYKKDGSGNKLSSSKFDVDYCAKLEDFFSSKKEINLDFNKINVNHKAKFLKDPTDKSFYSIRTIAPFYYLENLVKLNVAGHSVENLILATKHYKHIKTTFLGTTGEGKFSIGFEKKNAYSYFDKLISLDLSRNEEFYDLSNIGYMQNLESLNISETDMNVNGFNALSLGEVYPEAREANSEGRLVVRPVKILAYGVSRSIIPQNNDATNWLEARVHFSPSSKDYVFVYKNEIFDDYVEDSADNFNFKMPVFAYGKDFDQFLILGKAITLTVNDDRDFEEAYQNEFTSKFVNHFGGTTLSLKNGMSFIFGGVKKQTNLTSDGFRNSSWAWFTPQKDVANEIGGKYLTRVKIDSEGSIVAVDNIINKSIFKLVDAKSIDLSANDGQKNTFAILGGIKNVKWRSLKQVDHEKIKAKVLKNIAASEFTKIEDVYDVNKVKIPVIKENTVMRILKVEGENKLINIDKLGVPMPYDAAILVNKYSIETSEDVYTTRYEIIISGGIVNGKTLTSNMMYRIELIDGKYEIISDGALKSLSNEGRAGHKIVKIEQGDEERYLAIGGYEANGVALDNVEMFNKNTNGLVPGLKMRQARSNFEIVKFNDKFIIVGGVKKNLLASRSEADWAAFYNQPVGSDYTFKDFNVDLYCKDIKYVPKKNDGQEKYSLMFEVSNVCLSDIEYLEVKLKDAGTDSTKPLIKKMIFGQDEESTAFGSVLATKISMEPDTQESGTRDHSRLLLGGLGLDDSGSNVTDTIFVGK